MSLRSPDRSQMSRIMAKCLKAFIQTTLSQSTARQHHPHLIWTLWNEQVPVFSLLFILPLGFFTAVQQHLRVISFVVMCVTFKADRKNPFFSPPLSSFTLTDLMLHSHNHLQCVYITIDSSLSTSHKKKWNCYVFVYNSLLEIHGFFQGDKRTEVSTSSVKGDVWSNVKAVLIFLNCVCSVCHY